MTADFSQDNTDGGLPQPPPLRSRDSSSSLPPPLPEEADSQASGVPLPPPPPPHVTPDSAPEVNDTVAPPIGDTKSTGSTATDEPRRELPCEIYRAYLREVLKGSSRNVISHRKERKLLEQGISKLGLAEVYARQLLCQIAAECEKQMLSESTDEQRCSDSELDAPEVEEFLERAAAILAKHRGINAKSRVFLAAAGDELGLSREQADRAIASLQNARTGEQTSVSPEAAWEQQRIAAYDEYLKRSFTKLPQKLALPVVEQTWLEVAELRFGIAREPARRVIREATNKAGVRLVSLEQATEHIASLVAEVMNRSIRLDGPTRERVFNEGSQWGLTPMQVDTIVRDYVQSLRKTQDNERSLVGFAIAAIVCIVFVLFAFIGWATLSNRRRPPQSPIVNGLDHPGAPDLPTTPVTPIPVSQQWWSQHEDLVLALTQARVMVPEMRDVLAGLNDSDPINRASVYYEIVQGTQRLTNAPQKLAAMCELLANCLVYEPSETCVLELQQALLKLIPEVGQRLPNTRTTFDASYAVVRSIVASLMHPDIPGDRIPALQDTLAKAIGVRANLRLPLDEVQRQCSAALGRHLCRVLTSAAPQQPSIAGGSFLAIYPRLSRDLDRDAMDQVAVEFLAALLPAAKDAWIDYAALLEDAIASSNPLIVLRVLELYEQVTDEPLQTYLADRLQQRAGLFPQDLPVDEVAARVREALGATSTATNQERNEQWKQEADKLSKLAVASADDSETLLQQAVEFAHASTMAFALAQGDVGNATFDELQATGPRQINVSTPVNQPPSRRRGGHRNGTSAMAERQLLAKIQQIANPHRAPIFRAQDLKLIANMATYVEELEPEDAEKIASYLLRSKGTQEHDEILEVIETVTRWRFVRLAMADEVLQTRLPQDRVQQIMERALGRQVNLGDADDWQQRYRNLLLQQVADELAGNAGNPAPGRDGHDNARDALRDLYVIQARLAGAPAEQYAASATPADAFRVMLSAYVSQLPPSGPSNGSSAASSDLAHYLEAAEFYGGNDIRQLVLLQREWAHFLVNRLGDPKLAAQAVGLVQDLEQRDLAAESVLHQLCDGEKTILQLWQISHGS